MHGIPSIDPFIKRHQEIDVLMARSDFFQDQRRAAELSREHQKITNLVEIYNNLQKATKDLADNTELLKDPATDFELAAMAQEDIQRLTLDIEQYKKDLLALMIPVDPSDSRNTVFEIRAGVGGDEASLFAAQLYRMYSRYAESRGWKIEQMGLSESECGGLKEVSFLISGQDVYKTLKYESGVHRVQRVPATEASGRIHTSTVTVAVLPEAEEVDIVIDPSDLEISVCRASGPGGQGVNTTDSAVQMLHKPTGMMIYCADERSQLKNKAKALKVLRSRLLKMKEDEERAKYAANRKSQIGTGDRSERIRTYNFPQSRLTDHRINLTLHSLTQIMEGAIEDVIKALQDADLQEKINDLLKE